MSDSWRDDAPDSDTPDDGPRRGRLLRRLTITLLVLAVPAGGLVWLFQDELFHPFGDTRACEGSDAPLSGLLGPGGVPLPGDASEVHYYTQDGRTQVAFVSSRIPEFLHRAGFVPDDASPFDESYDEDHYALGEGETELPKGLCGTGVRGPVLTYGSSAATIMVERSPFTTDRFRGPARAIVTYGPS
ncbi:hypothetical protein ACIRD8_01435 [Streptomyces sp. NPDC102451]|uniref:hypothetical protein n=1 Tax=Streptomyces sp. NPDC102451 TaxID=3366177 RepID=UPI00381BCEC5